MGLKLTNNAVSRLASGITAVATSISVTPGDGAKFPALSAGDYFPATLIRGSDGAVEVVRVTARSTDVLTVTRAQEGTAGLVFVSGDRIELRLTADAAMDIPEAAISDAANKATLADADEFGVIDPAASNVLKNHTWANLKAGIWSALGALISGGTAKATPVDADTFALSDSAASNATKKTTWANVKATIKTYFDTLYLSLSGGTLTNFLTLHADPTSAMHAATMRYVDVARSVSFSNLKASASGTSASISATADEIVVKDASNKYKTLRSVSVAINTAINGANGLDTGTITASTWYAAFIIAKSDGTVAGLISTSATAPTMPADYTFFIRFGWIRTDGTANKYPLSFIQSGQDVQYKVAAGSNVAGLPIMISGVQGSTATPTWVAAATASFVPPTAVAIDVVAFHNATTGGGYIVAPNNSYGNNVSTTNPPPMNSSLGSTATSHQKTRIILESTNIYYAGSSSGDGVACSGWKDSN